MQPGKNHHEVLASETLPKSPKRLGDRVAGRRLAIEKGPLALHAPPITRQFPVAAYDPMTRNSDSDSV